MAGRSTASCPSSAVPRQGCGHRTHLSSSPLLLTCPPSTCRRSFALGTGMLLTLRSAAIGQPSWREQHQPNNPRHPIASSPGLFLPLPRTPSFTQAHRQSTCTTRQRREPHQSCTQKPARAAAYSPRRVEARRPLAFGAARAGVLPLLPAASGSSPASAAARPPRVLRERSLSGTAATARAGVRPAARRRLAVCGASCSPSSSSSLSSGTGAGRRLRRRLGPASASMSKANAGGQHAGATQILQVRVCGQPRLRPAPSRG